MFRLAALLSALALQTGAMAAEPVDQVGDRYEIGIRIETETHSDNGNSGNSGSGGLLIERVIAVGADGLQLEYDIPKSVSEQERTMQWQLPALIERSADGALKLLNAPELQARNKTWLSRAKLKPANCGQWYFTWSAFKIECDPQAALDLVRPFHLRFGPLVDGAPFNEYGGLGPAPLRQERSGPEGAVFVAEIAIDPDAVRRERAEADVAVAQMTGEPKLDFETAFRARAGNGISGKIVTRLETDAAGRVVRRVRTKTLEIRTADGLETEKSTETTNRRLLKPGE